MDTYEKVKEAIEFIVGPAQCKMKPYTELCDDLGVDSIDFVEIIMVLESEFDIDIPDMSFRTVTIQELTAMVDTRVKLK